MLSAQHEALVTAFRNRPELAAELLRHATGATLPEGATVRGESADFTQAHAVELRADHVVVLLAQGAPVLAIVVEVQLGCDAHKRYTWPAYGVLARLQHRCDAVVLVVALDPTVAAWADEAVQLGNRSVFWPLVVGRELVPIIRDPEVARGAPELAVLSATAHGSDPDVGAKVAFAAVGASAGLPDDTAKLYWDLIHASLTAATRAELEEMMASGNYEYQSDFARKYVAEGKAEGKAEAVLRVLAARGVEVTPEESARVLACTDLAVLDRWLQRAATATSASQVLT